MFKYFKHPEVPTSSPDKMTFPFEFGSFQYTMENFVKSFTRNRVTKENLTEVMEEVNAAVKSDSDSFKTWDYLSIVFLAVINAGILACILTIKVQLLTLFAIKLGVILVGIVLNFSIWACCLGGSTTRLRDKIQNILDQKDEYFDSKGMRWTVCTDTDFPYWIELHIQSQFEMKLAGEKRQAKKQVTSERDEEKETHGYSEEKGIYGYQGNSAQKNSKQGNARLMKPTKNGFADLGIEEDDEDLDQSDEQPKPKPAQQVEIDINSKKFNRLYAPLEEDYEETYEQDNDDIEANL